MSLKQKPKFKRFHDSDRGGQTVLSATQFAQLQVAPGTPSCPRRAEASPSWRMIEIAGIC